MTPVQRRHVGTFLFSLGLFVIGWIVVDYGFYRQDPTGGSTISWGMALLGVESPIAIFAFGHVTGALLWGLAFHFWWGEPKPAMWDELSALRAENATLRAGIAFKAGN